MIAIVCGGRDYWDERRVRAVLDAAVTRLRLDTIIEGGASGADFLAREWAQARNDISIIEVPANWDDQGKAAGPIRNRLMFDILCGGGSGIERAVIAFPGNEGTANMIGLGSSPRAKQMNVALHRITP